MNYQYLIATACLLGASSAFSACPRLTSEERRMKAEFVKQTIVEYAHLKNGGKVDKDIINEYIDKSNKYCLDLDRPVDENGKTLLIYGTLSGHKTPVRTLRKQNVDMNKGDKKGLTALDYARKVQDQSMVEYLTKYGARDTKKSKKAKNA